MKTHRLVFDLSALAYGDALYTTARVATRMRLELDAEYTERRDGMVVWVVDVEADSADAAEAQVRKFLKDAAPLVEVK